jgi:hypothetical protein
MIGPERSEGAGHHLAQCSHGGASLRERSEPCEGTA